MKEVSVRSLLVPLIILMVCNILSLTLINETLLSTTDNTFRQTARVSSYLTILINASLLAFMLLVIFTTSWYFTSVFSIEVKKANYLAAIKNFILCYIVYEVLKMVIAYLFLTDIASENMGNPAFIETVNNSSWAMIQKTFDILFIIISPVVFGFTLSQLEKLKLSRAVMVSLPVLLVLLILNKNLFLN
jgi:hypothetical protein